MQKPKRGKRRKTRAERERRREARVNIPNLESEEDVCRWSVATKARPAHIAEALFKVRRRRRKLHA
jgi:hypothetical protein